MTPAAGPDLSTGSVIRRLRAWPVSSWRSGDRMDVARRCLQELAELAAQAEDCPVHEVPDAGPHALGDQLAVLVDDARRVGVPTAPVDAAVAQLAAALGLAPGLR